MEENKNLQSDLTGEELQSLTEDLAKMTQETTDKNLEIPARPNQERSQQLYSRRQRRQVQKFFNRRQRKQFPSTNLNLPEWMSKVRQNQLQGKQLQERHDALQMERLEDYLVDKEKSIRASMQERGIANAEIDAYIETWYDDLKLWKEEVA